MTELATSGDIGSQGDDIDRRALHLRPLYRVFSDIRLLPNVFATLNFSEASLKLLVSQFGPVLSKSGKRGKAED